MGLQFRARMWSALGWIILCLSVVAAVYIVLTFPATYISVSETMHNAGYGSVMSPGEAQSSANAFAAQILGAAALPALACALLAWRNYAGLRAKQRHDEMMEQLRVQNRLLNKLATGNTIAPLPAQSALSRVSS